jgi:hypothetical protein
LGIGLNLDSILLTTRYSAPSRKTYLLLQYFIWLCRPLSCIIESASGYFQVLLLYDLVLRIHSRFIVAETAHVQHLDWPFLNQADPQSAFIDILKVSK